MDDTERKTAHLKHKFNDLFYNNKEIKDLSVKINPKEGAQIIQQKRRPIPTHLQKQLAKEF